MGGDGRSHRALQVDQGIGNPKAQHTIGLKQLRASFVVLPWARVAGIRPFDNSGLAGDTNNSPSGKSGAVQRLVS